MFFCALSKLNLSLIIVLIFAVSPLDLFGDFLPFLTAPRNYFVEDEVKREHLSGPAAIKKSEEEISQAFLMQKFPVELFLSIMAAFYWALYVTSEGGKKIVIDPEEQERRDLVRLVNLYKKGDTKKCLSSLFSSIRTHFKLSYSLSSEETIDALSRRDDAIFWKNTLRSLDQWKFSSDKAPKKERFALLFEETLSKLQTAEPESKVVNKKG